MRLNLRTLLGLAFGLLLSTGAPALADSFLGVNWGPGFGADQHPGIVFVITDSGINAVDGMQPPYDGIEDTWIGVINNSSTTVTQFDVSSPNLRLYGFDGDGIDVSPFNSPGNASDVANGDTGYGGPQAFFTNIHNAFMAGTVNFENGIAPGGNTYFSLEEDSPAASLVGSAVNGDPAAPEPTRFLLAGMGVLGLLGYKWGRRKQVA